MLMVLEWDVQPAYMSVKVRCPHTSGQVVYIIRKKRFGNMNCAAFFFNTDKSDVYKNQLNTRSISVGRKEVNVIHYCNIPYFLLHYISLLVFI